MRLTLKFSILTFLIIISIIPFVYAQEYSQGENLYVYFYNATDGTVFDKHKCYLTVRFNNDTIILNRINMTNAGAGRYNWTINSSLPIDLTKPYVGMVNCSANDAETDNWVSWQSFYIVGSKSTNMSYAVAVIFATGMASFLFCWLGINHKGAGLFDRVLKIFLILMGMVFVTATMGLAASIARTGGASTATQNIINMLAANTTLSLYFFFSIIMLSFLIGVILYFAKSAKKPKGIR